jgi:ketosteroid isomerase-like protein
MEMGASTSDGPDRDGGGTAAESRGVVLAWLDALMAGDLERVLGTFSEDCVIRLPGRRESTPWAGEWRGREAIRECFDVIGRTLEIRSHEFLHVIADGDLVVVVGNEVSASKTTGRVIRQTYAWLFRVRDGRICLYQLFEIRRRSRPPTIACRHEGHVAPSAAIASHSARRFVHGRPFSGSPPQARTVRGLQLRAAAPRAQAGPASLRRIRGPAPFPR